MRSKEICHFQARAMQRSRKARFHLCMSIILFAAKHSWMTLSMSRPLFVGSYLQVTWWALGQWKGRQICIIGIKCSPHFSITHKLWNLKANLHNYILHFSLLSIIIMITSNEHNSKNSSKRDWWINSQVYHCYQNWYTVNNKPL